MLTNNKKRSFVKLLALTLAALMVFSVCLTGCTDQDARDQAADALNKAESAQSAADAAQTAEEVAAAIAKAIAEIDTSVDAEAVKKLIADELTAKKVATTDDLTKFLTEETKAWKDLVAKVNGFTSGLSKDEVNKAIADAAVNAATKAILADYVKKSELGAAITADMVLAHIEKIKTALDATYVTHGELTETLKGYVKTEALKAELAKYFGTMNAADVLSALTAIVKDGALDGVMTLDEWNKATGKVLYLLGLQAEQMEEMAKYIYSAETKALINAEYNKCFGVDADGNAAALTYDVFSTDADENGSVELGIAILRLPNVAELDRIIDIFEDMKKFPSFEMELEALIMPNPETSFKELYEIGTLVVVDDDMNKTGDKFAAETVYHGVKYAKDAVMKAQVVTDADTADFEAFKVALDALIVKYAELNDARFEYDSSDIYRKAVKTADKTVSGWYVTLPAGYEWTNEKTVGISVDVGVTNMTTTATAAGFHMEGFFDEKNEAPRAYEPAIRVDLAGGYTVAGLQVDVMDRFDEEAAVAYAAIETMLADVEAAKKDVTDHFGAFLTKMGAINENYVAALRDYMCTAEFLGTASYIPDAWKSNSEYLLDEITGYFNYAQNIRGKTTTEGLYKADVYEDLKYASWDCLIDNYRDKALDILDVMVNDYIIAVQAAKLAYVPDGTNLDVTTLAGDAAAELGYSATGTYADGEKWTEKFVENFFKGNKHTWSATLLADVDMLGLNDYMVNNLVAIAPDLVKKDGAALDAGILEVLASAVGNMKHELNAAALYPRHDIINLDRDDVAGTSQDDIKTAFSKILKKAQANLDETIVRYTFVELKEGVLNNLYAEVDAIAKFYTADKPAAYDDVANALKLYLTGYSDAYVAAGEAVVSKTTYTADGVTFADVDLAPSGYAWSELAKLIYEDWSSPKLEDGVDMDDAATQLFNTIFAEGGLYDTAIATMENIAIRMRFADYLDEARSTLWFTYHAYKTQVKDYALATALTAAYNDQVDEISGVEYRILVEESRNVLGEYKDAYIDLLNIVISKDSTYYPLIDTKDIAGFDAWVKAAKSSTVDAAAYTNLIKPAEYHSAGAAINAFDQAVNANAYKTATNEALYK